MSFWNSIDSAPRDGSFIRGIDEEGSIFVCRWYSRDQIAEWSPSDNSKDLDPAWYEGDEYDEELFPVSWQPLES